MSEMKKGVFNLRRTLVQVGLLVVYVALIGLSFVTGKGHTILVDNKDNEAAAVTAFEDVVVGMDRQETLELMPGDRDMFKVKGQRHRISVEVAGQGEKVVRDFSLSLDSDMVVINLPKLVKGIEPYWETFVPIHTAPVAQDSEEAFTSPDAVVVPVPGAPAIPAPPPAP